MIDNEKYLLTKIITKGKILNFGRYILSNGIESPYFLDFTLLSSRIDLLKTLVDLIDKQFSRHIELEDSDKLVGILDKGAAITVPLAIKKMKPFALFSPDKDVLSVGLIDSNDDVVLVDDMLSTGKTVKKVIDVLDEEYYVKVNKVYVALDREEGGYHLLRKNGVKVFRLAKISDIAKTLYELGMITEEEYNIILDHIDGFKKEYGEKTA